MGWRRSISRLFSVMTSANSGMNTSGKKRGNSLRDGIQREIQKRAVRGSQDKVVVAAVGVKAGEQALPKHIEACRAKAQQRAAGYNKRQRGIVNVDGADKAAPTQQVRRAGKHDDELARGAGEVVHAHGAGEIAQREHKRLRQEEPERDLRRLEIHGQKREHAAPNAGGVDG